MYRKPNSAVIFVVGGLVMLTLLGCSVGRSIVKGPQTPTATATATHRATFTATISPTPRPSATPTATSKAPVAVLSTDTVVAPMESATMGRVRPQSARPSPPAVTAAPAQANMPFASAIVGSLPNRGTTDLPGFGRDTYQTSITDFRIRIWTDTWKALRVTSGGDPGNDQDRNQEAKIGDQVAPESWPVALVDAQDSSEVLSPIGEMTGQNCEGSGAAPWTKVDFTKQS
jgi:hypothetical protein